jgi:hypothetical protein
LWHANNRNIEFRLQEISELDFLTLETGLSKNFSQEFHYTLHIIPEEHRPQEADYNFSFSNWLATKYLPVRSSFHNNL